MSGRRRALEVASGLRGEYGARGRIGSQLDRLDAGRHVLRYTLSVDTRTDRAPLASPIEQHVRPDDVCLDEVARLEDGAVDVGLGRQVDHGSHPSPACATALGVCNVPLVEFVRDVEEVLSAARVGQLVEDDDGVTCRREAASDWPPMNPQAPVTRTRTAPC